MEETSASIKSRYLHINRRLMERFGISIDWNDFGDLDKRFLDGDYNHLHQTKSGCHVIEMDIQGNNVYLLVRNYRLTTVLSKNQAEKDISTKYLKKLKDNRKQFDMYSKEHHRQRGNRNKLDKKQMYRKKNKDIKRSSVQDDDFDI